MKDSAKPKLLWIVPNTGKVRSLSQDILCACQVNQCNITDNIACMIDGTDPDVICFEFDYPHPEHLAIMSEIKQDYLSIPVLMLTEHHSEKLAVWALRTRVWDYLVKPITTQDLMRPILLLHKILNQQSERPRLRVEQKCEIPGINMNTTAHLTKSINIAKCYIESNIERKLTESDIAKMVGLSPHHFSRSFKQIIGINYRDFIIMTRINLAKELLLDRNKSVTQICYEVGFRDLSNFTRAFNRQSGMTPSTYRKQTQPQSQKRVVS